MDAIRSYAKSKFTAQEVRERTANNTNDSVFAAGAESLQQGEDAKFAVLKYPLDLQEKQHPHYVMFFITIRKGDMSAEEYKKSSATVQFDQSQQNRIPPSASPVLQTVEGTVGGASALGGLGGAIGGFSGAALAAATLGAAGAVVGGAVGATAGASKALVDNRTQVLLKTAIALHINQVPSSSYSASWETGDTGIFGGAAQQLASIGAEKQIEILKRIGRGTGFGDSMKALAEIVAQSSFTAAGAADYYATERVAGVSQNLYNAARSAAGQVPNPFKAQLFKNMNYRKFIFDYVFLPKDEFEYRTIQEILHTFKVYMHPKLGIGKFVMDYPAEFTLGFYHKDQLNKELFKVSNCALTNMSVQYGGEDFTTFKDIPGAPTEIGLKLEFTELEMLTRERVEFGY